MEHVRGRVLNSDQVLAEGIEITAVIDRRGPTRSWHGCFIVSGPWPSKLTGPLTLEFDDGRSGKTVVRKVKDADANHTTVLFEGKSTLV